MSDNGDRELWANYRKSPTIENRNAIFDYWYPFIARTVKCKSHDSYLSAEELLSVASERILSATISNFRASKGSFSTYLKQSIHFAALDAAREQDRLFSISRLTRTRSKRLEERAKSLTQEIGRNPTDSEIAEAAGKSERDVIATKQSVPTRVLGPEWIGTEKDTGLGVYAANFLDWISEIKVRPDAREVFDYFTRGMPKRHKFMLWKYYFEHYLMYEIGDMLEISESRVSQEMESCREFLKKNRDKLESFADLKG